MMNTIRTLGRALFWLTWPLSYSMMRNSWRTRALIICNDEVLVVKTWIGTGQWGLAGGGLHKAEPVIDGLLREVREEVGLVFTAEDCQSLGQYTFQARGLPFNTHLFAIRVSDKPVVKLQAIEISAAAWMHASEFTRQNSLPEVAESLKRLAEQG